MRAEASLLDYAECSRLCGPVGPKNGGTRSANLPLTFRTEVISVDAHKSNSHISLTPAELDNFVQLLQQANKKLDEIK